ncbi:MAG: hypothetical protein WB762_03420 [Candidatus Sulfotelmatobacter sp.]
MFGFIPNFYVTYEDDPAPLTAKRIGVSFAQEFIAGRLTKETVMSDNLGATEAV